MVIGFIAPLQGTLSVCQEIGNGYSYRVAIRKVNYKGIELQLVIARLVLF